MDYLLPVPSALSGIVFDVVKYNINSLGTDYTWLRAK